MDGAPPPPRVVYLRDDVIALTDFSAHVSQHAMKPYRTLATHTLVEALGLTKHMIVCRPPLLPLSQLRSVHTDMYLQGLQRCHQRTWEHVPLTQEDIDKIGIPLTTDCPLLEGLMDYSCSIASGTLFGARLICEGKADVAIHWAGGMHHARASECSGFCYINDINVGIMELLRRFYRVLYVDLDVHHGDGVEEAFAWTDRVFTLSLHKFGESFFPGTGHGSDIGFGPGRYYSLNVPLVDGVGDTDYISVFTFALDRIQTRYRPEVVVVQCGADSLAGDRVGVLNLSSVGQARCVERLMQLGVPVLALGGGGYTMRNVARLWAYETAILCGHPLSPGTRVLPPPAGAAAHEAEGSIAAMAAKVAAGQQQLPPPARSPPPAVSERATTSKRGGKRARSHPRAAANGAHLPAVAASADDLAAAANLDTFQRLAVGTGAAHEAEGVPLRSCRCGLSNAATTRRVESAGEQEGHRTGCSGTELPPPAIITAAAEGMEATLRSVFRPQDTLYVPPEEGLVPKTNVSSVMERLRRMIEEHMTHVKAPQPPQPATEGAAPGDAHAGLSVDEAHMSAKIEHPAEVADTAANAEGDSDADPIENDAAARSVQLNAASEGNDPDAELIAAGSAAETNQDPALAPVPLPRDSSVSSHAGADDADHAGGGKSFP